MPCIFKGILETNNDYYCAKYKFFWQLSVCNSNAKYHRNLLNSFGDETSRTAMSQHHHYEFILHQSEGCHIFLMQLLDVISAAGLNKDVSEEDISLEFVVPYVT
jgi:hypothetical protein